MVILLIFWLFCCWYVFVLYNWYFCLCFWLFFLWFLCFWLFEWLRMFFFFLLVRVVDWRDSVVGCECVMVDWVGENVVCGWWLDFLWLLYWLSLLYVGFLGIGFLFLWMWRFGGVLYGDFVIFLNFEFGLVFWCIMLSEVLGISSGSSFLFFVCCFFIEFFWGEFWIVIWFLKVYVVYICVEGLFFSIFYFFFVLNFKFVVWFLLCLEKGFFIEVEINYGEKFLSSEFIWWGSIFLYWFL